MTTATRGAPVLPSLVQRCLGWLVLPTAFCAFAATAQAGDWPALSEPPTPEAGGSADAALLIGIEDYVFLPDIPGAEANIRDWYSWLKKTRGVPTVKVLAGADATRERIIAEAKRATGRVEEGGTLWVVFVGHGAPSKDGKDGILVGSDANLSPDSLYDRSVLRSDLVEILDTNGAEHQTVVLLDACFSGHTGGGDRLVSGLMPALPSGTWTPPTPKSQALLLTAAQGDQFAGPLPGAERPAFSYLALGALRGWGDRDKDGQVTAREAVDYANDTLYEALRGRTQEPELLGVVPDLVLARPVPAESGPDLDAIVTASLSSASEAPDETEPAPSPSAGADVKTISLSEPVRPVEPELPLEPPLRVGVEVQAIMPDASLQPLAVFEERGQVTLPSCSGVRFEVKPSQRAWMYMLYRNKAQPSLIHPLWPAPKAKVQQVAPGEAAQVPLTLTARKSNFIFLDEETGHEELYLVASPRALELSDLEAMADDATGWPAQPQPQPTETKVATPQRGRRARPAPSAATVQVASTAATSGESFQGLLAQLEAAGMPAGLKGLFLGQVDHTAPGMAELSASVAGEPVVFVLEIEHVEGLASCPEGWRYQP